ncbi:unnamed protein product [Calicophoron daubneyi]|uniref:C2H2-type domain-containing protein n=1 Tax=Calicophoron daubneyi TaxID=300641 RepID=A0AAV2TDP5_CALDB
MSEIPKPLDLRLLSSLSKRNKMKLKQSVRKSYRRTLNYWEGEHTSEIIRNDKESVQKGCNGSPQDSMDVFICPMCRQQSLGLQSFVEHMAIHMGAKPLHENFEPSSINCTKPHQQIGNERMKTEEDKFNLDALEDKNHKQYGQTEDTRNSPSKSLVQSCPATTAESILRCTGVNTKCLSESETPSTAEKFECCICSGTRKYQDAFELISHVQENHMNTVYECVSCKLHYPTRLSCLNHIFEIHFEQYPPLPQKTSISADYKSTEDLPKMKVDEQSLPHTNAAIGKHSVLFSQLQTLGKNYTKVGQGTEHHELAFRGHEEFSSLDTTSWFTQPVTSYSLFDFLNQLIHLQTRLCPLGGAESPLLPVSKRNPNTYQQNGGQLNHSTDTPQFRMNNTSGQQTSECSSSESGADLTHHCMSSVSQVHLPQTNSDSSEGRYLLTPNSDKNKLSEDVAERGAGLQCNQYAMMNFFKIMSTYGPLIRSHPVRSLLPWDLALKIDSCEASKLCHFCLKEFPDEMAVLRHQVESHSLEEVSEKSMDTESLQN